MQTEREITLSDALVSATGAEVRAAIRAGHWTSPTAGLARGYVQVNLVVLPAADAADFAEFCRLNPRPCPLLEQTTPGDPQPRRCAPGADLRTDVPRYRVFRQGVLEPTELTDVSHFWRDDLAGFLLGCSFTFEHALASAGLPVRHVDERRNVPMYRTSQACRPAGRFSGNLVVSMRPLRPEQVEQAIAITSRFPTMHGAPIHVGDPGALGIANLARPEFGEPVTIHPGEVPVFWACGVTPQLALLDAKPELAITHSPGCMFVTDWKDAEFDRGQASGA
ncbi:MAG: putative hydro-lyase [Pirellulales bacterium]